MRFINIIKHLIVNFRTKHRLSFINLHTNEELLSVFLSPAKVVMVFFAICIITFAAVLLIVTYTPLLDMIPGYPGNKSREILIQNVIKLDSLEKAIKNWEIYESNITAIMNGKAPVSLTASQNVDSIKKSADKIVTPSASDSLFRDAILTDNESKQRAKDKRTIKNTRSFGLYTPMQGVVSKPFDIGEKRYGVEVTSSSQQEVLSVNDGVVIFNSWTPTDGYITQVQHSGNMISIYKHLSRQLKEVGERVKAGQVIGYVGSDDLTMNEAGVKVERKPILLFELWDNGTAVDPLNYMIF